MNKKIFPLHGIDASSMLAFESSEYAVMLSIKKRIDRFRPESQQQAYAIEDVISKNGAAYSYPARLKLCAQEIRDIDNKYIVLATIILHNMMVCHRVAEEEMKVILFTTAQLIQQMRSIMLKRKTWITRSRTCSPQKIGGGVTWRRNPCGTFVYSAEEHT